MMCRAFGQHGVHISSHRQLTGSFNKHLLDCAVLFADEAFWPGDKSAEGTLKRIITEETLMIEAKFFDATMNLNRLHIIMASNADWVVPAAIDDRRCAVFDVSEQHRNDKKYFVPLYAEMEQGGIAAMMHDLLAMDLGGWHPRYDVPQTKALGEQKIHSLSAEDEWWLGLLQTGDLPGPIDLNQNPRLAQSKALLEHAHKTVFRLRYCTEHRLGRLLKRYGCDRQSDWRIRGKRAWQFPPLKEARAAWNEKVGVATEWEPTSEWEHSQDYM
jgi:hypothetical protein